MEKQTKQIQLKLINGGHSSVTQLCGGYDLLTAPTGNFLRVNAQMHNLDKQKTTSSRKTLAASGGQTFQRNYNNMTKKIILLSFVLFLSFSCSNENTETQDRVDPDTLLMMRTMNERNEPLDTLKKRVLENGDVEAYDELMIGLLDYSIELRIKWSKIMANKHDYVRAYRDYVGEMSMKCSPDPPFSCLTKNEKDTVSLFLNRAIEKGDSSAIELKKEYNLK